MNSFAFVSLVAAAISLILAALVYSSNSKSKVNRFFALACIFLAYMAFVEYGLRQSHSESEAMVWTKLDALWPIGITVIFQFIVTFTQKWKFLSEKWAHFILYIPALSLTGIYIAATDLIYPGVVESHWGWAYTHSFSVISWVYNIWIVFIAVLAAIIIWSYYLKQKNNRKKQQAKYIAIGYSVPLVLGLLSTTLFSPLGTNVPDLTLSAWAIGALFIWYGIWKHRLFTIDPTTAAESIFDTMSDLLFLVDNDGKIIRLNQAALDALGYRQEELIGQLLKPLVTETELTMTALQEMHTDEIHDIKDRRATMQSKSGALIPVSISPSVLRDHSGKTAGFLFTARDMTERKQMEDEIRKLHSAIEQANDGIAIFNRSDRKITYANHSFAQMLGYGPKEVTGRQFRELINSFESNRYSSLGDVLNEDQIVIKTVEAEYTRKDGTVFPALLSVNYIRDENGVADAVLAVSKDITESKMINDQLVAQAKELEQMNVHLQEADRLKSIFLASMSHELRTPLNSVLGFTGIMLQGLTGDINEEQRHQLTMVKSSATHLLSLINDVLDLSKLEAGKFQLTVDGLSLDALIEEVLNTVSPLSDAKQLPIDTDIEQDIHLYSDERRIKQILINLLGNSIKFTQEGSISFSAKLKNKTTLELIVKDTGIGINDENLSKLFKPFAQIKDQLTKNIDGTGLGLYLSKKLANLMGGDLTAISQAGKGSEFTCVLPLDIREDN